ncbi:MAG: hypothetical protein HBSAPP01_04920 [Candidatus Brocadia sapporoensis]|nr:MAG: hypothetical protein HBSAPP01_04920 [Candidatus Brocadia sapporoensis]
MTASTVKKTISLPENLAREAEMIAEEEGKTLSAVIQVWQLMRCISK